MGNTNFSICTQCKNYWGESKCKAYPNGIPDDIWQKKISHKKPYLQANDTVYEYDRDLVEKTELALANESGINTHSLSFYLQLKLKHMLGKLGQKV